MNTEHEMGLSSSPFFRVRAQTLLNTVQHSHEGKNCLVIHIERLKLNTKSNWNEVKTKFAYLLFTQFVVCNWISFESCSSNREFRREMVGKKEQNTSP